MPATITLPELHDKMTDGSVVCWLMQEGDRVRLFDVLAEIETDQAIVDLEAFDAGTLALILVPPGRKAKVGHALAVITYPGETAADVRRFLADRHRATSDPWIAAAHRSQRPVSRRARLRQRLRRPGP